MCGVMPRLHRPRGRSRGDSARRSASRASCRRRVSRRVERLGGRVRQRPRLGADPLGEAAPAPGVDGVGLGQPPDGLGEVAHLARIDDHDGQPAAARAATTAYSKPPVASSTTSVGARECTAAELGQGRGLIGDCPPLARRPDGEIEVAFDTSMPTNTPPATVASTREGPRPGPALRDAGSSPGQLFGLATRDG